MQTLLLCVMVALAMLGWCECVGAMDVDAKQIRPRLGRLPAEPRLLLRRGEEAEIQRRIAIDPQLAALWDLIHRSADAMLTEPLVRHEVIGRRLLNQSRLCLRRMTHLGMAYRLTGDRRYADRAKADLLAAAAFDDWNPSHFLDTAEMTAAVAIGLDWLHDALDEPTRATLRQAILTKGIEPSFKGEPSWAKGRNNWNQVCNAGMALGAIAIAGEHPDVAATVIARAIAGVPYAMQEYAPDGAYPEGPMYWGYGTNFNILLIAALEKAFGDDFGLGNAPAFARTAEYYLHVAGPTGLYFNYADANQRGAFSPAPAMFYFATRTGNPGLLFTERQMLGRVVTSPRSISPANTERLLPLILVWGRAHVGSLAAPQARHYVGQGTTPVALFRSAWDESATFAGIKGGQGAAPHGHQDAGTFVIDMRGARFVEDLGLQDYHSLESRGIRLFDLSPDSQRWKVFRLGAGAHNVLTVNGKDHNLKGRAEIVATTPASATLDLTPVYVNQLARATRTLRLHDDGSVSVRDEVRAGSVPAMVRWTIVTGAKVAIDKEGAILSREGKRIRLRITGDQGLILHSRPADPPADYDAPNPGKTLVWFEVSLKPQDACAWTAQFVPVD